MPALPKDEFADVTGLVISLGEDAFKRSPVGRADALAWRQPDSLIGTDRHHVPQMQLLLLADKIVTLPIPSCLLAPHSLQKPTSATPG